MVEIDKHPIKGQELIGLDKNGVIHFISRCDCNNEKCYKWKCLLTNITMSIEIVKWYPIKKFKNKFV